MSDDERTNQYGVVQTETRKCLTGLELLTRVMHGTLTAPPIHQTLDFRLIKVDPRMHGFRRTPRYDYYNPLNSIHGGYIAALLIRACRARFTQPLISGTAMQLWK